MKRIGVLIAILLGLSLGVKAQLKPIVESEYQAKGFTLANELWMCSSYAYNINMSITAFNTTLSSQGKWFQLVPGKYTTAKNAGVSQFPTFPEQLVSTSPVSNIFNVMGKDCGVYEFLYVNEKENFCQMQVGDQVLFRIYVVPELTGFSIKTPLCDGHVASVNFMHHLPDDVSNFAALMGWGIKFDYKGTAQAMPLVVNSSLVGTRSYTYTINDGSGVFKDKYSDLVKSKYGCLSYAVITHSVEISTDPILNVPEDKSITYCLDNVRKQYPDNYNFNPNSILNFTVTDAKWSVIDSDAAGTTIDPVTGNAIVKMIGRGAPSTVKFQYKFQHCDNTDGIVNVTLVFGNTELNNEIHDKDKTLCRNFASGDVKLMSLLDVSVPSTAGNWTNPDKTLNHQGTINLANLLTGSSYTYKYNVSLSALESLCQITNYEAKLTLTVQDANAVASGEAQLCKDVFEEGTAKIDLSTYVANIPKSGIIWKRWNSATNQYDEVVTNPDQYEVKAPNLKLGTNIFKFEYTGICGKADGELYLTVTDRITNYIDNKEAKYCFEDFGAEAINLEQILGVAGLKGTWAIVSSNVNAANLNGNIFNGYKQYTDDSATDAQVYVFEYTPAPSEGCLGTNNAKVTIIITPDIVN